MKPMRNPMIGRPRKQRAGGNRRVAAFVPATWAALLLLAAIPAWAQVTAPAERKAPSTSAASDSLPFAKNSIPPGYPAFGLGFGLTVNRATYSGLEHGLTRIEDWYRGQGYMISAHGAVSITPLKLWLATVRVKPSFELLAQFGGSMNKSKYLRLSDLLFIARGRPFGSESPSFFAGLGMGRYSFSWTQTYGNIVSPTDPSGWDELDYIRLTKSGSYGTATGGVTFHSGPNARLDLYAQYLGMKPLRLATQHVGTMQVDLSGALLGARVTVYF